MVSLTIFWVGRGEVFLNFAAKGTVGELSKSFLLVEAGAPKDYRATLVGRFDSDVFAFTKV